MSDEKEPKFSCFGESLSGGAERGLTGSVHRQAAADRHTDLAESLPCKGHGIKYSSLDDRKLEKSCSPVGFNLLVELFTVDNKDNLATGTETLLPFRTHEQATVVSIFSV